MINKDFKDGVAFGLAIVFAAFLVWMGYKFFRNPEGILSNNEQFFLGLVLVLSGVFSISLGTSYAIMASFSLMILGFYLLARASGVLTLAVVPTLLGIASWLAAFILIIMFWPHKKD